MCRRFVAVELRFFCTTFPLRICNCCPQPTFICVIARMVSVSFRLDFLQFANQSGCLLLVAFEGRDEADFEQTALLLLHLARPSPCQRTDTVESLSYAPSVACTAPIAFQARRPLRRRFITIFTSTRGLSSLHALAPYTFVKRDLGANMPVPQLPIELIQLIVADPALRKADLRSLSLTARVFPPLVRPHLFERLQIPIGWTVDDSVSANKFDEGPAITLDEMDRLMSLRRRPDLAGLVKEVVIDRRWGLKPPPGSIRMTAHVSMQLVYAIFPRLEQAAASTDWLPQLAMTPPREPLPCCEVLNTLHYLRLDAHTWKGLQMCPALRHLSIAEMSLDKGVPAALASLSVRLETLDFDWLWQNKTGNVFLQRILHACGPSLKHLNLGVIWGNVRDLSMLPSLASLTVYMKSDDEVEETGETLDAWLAEVLPTCTALERLDIDTPEVGHKLRRSPQRLLAEPEVAAALPTTLKRIDFNMALKEGELEAVLSNNSSVKVISMLWMVRPISALHKMLLFTTFYHAQPDSARDFCRERGITVRRHWEDFLWRT